MKYNEKKLNAYWEKWDKIRANWRRNGWKGHGHPHGRDVKYPCGHAVWAGFGLSDEHLKECVQCKRPEMFNEED